MSQRSKTPRLSRRILLGAVALAVVAGAAVLFWPGRNDVPTPVLKEGQYTVTHPGTSGSDGGRPVQKAALPTIRLKK